MGIRGAKAWVNWSCKRFLKLPQFGAVLQMIFQVAPIWGGPANDFWNWQHVHFVLKMIFEPFFPAEFLANDFSTILDARIYRKWFFNHSWRKNLPQMIFEPFLTQEFPENDFWTILDARISRKWFLKQMLRNISSENDFWKKCNLFSPSQAFFFELNLYLCPSKKTKTTQWNCQKRKLQPSP